MTPKPVATKRDSTGVELCGICCKNWSTHDVESADYTGPVCDDCHSAPVTKDDACGYALRLRTLARMLDEKPNEPVWCARAAAAMVREAANNTLLRTVTLLRMVTWIREFSLAHHAEEPSGVHLHRLLVDIPQYLDHVIEILQGRAASLEPWVQHHCECLARRSGERVDMTDMRCSCGLRQAIVGPEE